MATITFKNRTVHIDVDVVDEGPFKGSILQLQQDVSGNLVVKHWSKTDISCKVKVTPIDGPEFECWVKSSVVCANSADGW
jgi:hypothetical protein